jgi:hypothetical protein
VCFDLLSSLLSGYPINRFFACPPKRFKRNGSLKGCMLRKGDERDILVAKFEIEYEETFHLKNLYKLLKEWLDVEGYKAYKAGEVEDLYFERVNLNGSKEYHIWWRAVRVPYSNTYYRYFIKIDYQGLNMKSTEVMHQGLKFKTDKGDLIMRVDAWLQLDYMNKWKDHFILKHFDSWYRKRIYKNKIELLKVDLYKAAYRLNNTIKQYLKLKTSYDMPKPFHQEKGI